MLILNTDTDPEAIAYNGTPITKVICVDGGINYLVWEAMPATLGTFGYTFEDTGGSIRFENAVRSSMTYAGSASTGRYPSAQYVGDMYVSLVLDQSNSLRMGTSARGQGMSSVGLVRLNGSPSSASLYGLPAGFSSGLLGSAIFTMNLRRYVTDDWTGIYTTLATRMAINSDSSGYYVRVADQSGFYNENLANMPAWSLAADVASPVYVEQQKTAVVTNPGARVY
jgi:hypothetical protein